MFLVAILISLAAVSAANTSKNLTTKVTSKVESKTIQKKVSNEYETKTKNVKSETSSSTTNTNTQKQHIYVTSNNVQAYANDKVTFNATAKYLDGRNLDKEAEAVYKINDKSIGENRIVNGITSLNYTIPAMKAGDYKLTVKIGETSTSLSNYVDTKLTILKHSTITNISNINVKSGQTVNLTANVKYENGALANGQKAVFKVNKKTVGTTTVQNGVAKLTYKVPNSANNYPLLVKIGESTLSKSSSASAVINVSKRSVSVKKDLVFFVQKKYKYINLNFKFTNSANVPATGKVAIKVDDKTIAKVRLENSSITYRYNAGKLKLGKHKVQIVYGGSNALLSKKATSYLRVQEDPVSTYTYSQVLEKAKSTENFIVNNKMLPNYALMNDNEVSMPDFLYMLSQVFYTNGSYHNGGFSAPSSSATSSAYGTLVYKADYQALAKTIVKSYINKGKAPSSIVTKAGVKMSFQDCIYCLCRAAAFTLETGQFPNYSTLTDVRTATARGSSTNTGTNTNTNTNTNTEYTSTNTVPAGFSSYLEKTKNCEVGSSSIISAVKTATKGVSGTYNQAKAIFDYVNQRTSYSSYFNTRYGAVGTLSRGYGNCVDTSHLVIAMMRTAKIPARYCHSTCYFRSGLVVGHVWAEVYVGGKWYYCDGTSRSNSFGNIVNWNRCTSINRYTSLPF